MQTVLPASMDRSMISVVLPVLDEAATIERALLPLQPLRGCEIE